MRLGDRDDVMLGAASSNNTDPGVLERMSNYRGVPPLGAKIAVRHSPSIALSL